LTAPSVVATGATGLTAGANSGNAGVLTLKGSTSGAATITAPAVAGTATNTILISNSLQLPSGTVYGWNADTGLSRIAPGVVYVGNGTAGSLTGEILASTGSFMQIQNANSGVTVYSGTAPTISSGFGSSPSIPNSNGTAAFTVNVGSGGTASTGVITMPSATTGWACFVAPNGAPQAAAVTYSAPTSVSSVTLTNYTLTTGVALAWTANKVLQVSCWAY